jgi:Ca-activated chloride channel homolog
MTEDNPLAANSSNWLHGKSFSSVFLVLRPIFLVFLRHFHPADHAHFVLTPFAKSEKRKTKSQKPLAAADCRNGDFSLVVATGRAVPFLAAFFLLLTVATPVQAESASSKNKTGNRLFGQGRFQDAEKAYLDAQASMPGRPELSYNLGNSLIKQQKYDQALQALAQAIGKGDKELQAHGYYNVGNALFDMGKYNESAQSYIQALNLSPADADAKHNLELALRKMQEQKQQRPRDNQSQAQNQEPEQQKPEGGNKEDKGKEQPASSQKENKPPQSQEARKPADPQSSKATGREGSFSKERALQILDALQNQELAEQRKLLERQARRKTAGRDW